jgi:hypothetical protein
MALRAVVGRHFALANPPVHLTLGRGFNAHLARWHLQERSPKVFGEFQGYDAIGARTDDMTGLSGSYRYIRMYGIARTTGYGYSVWEFDVYGN